MIDWSEILRTAVAALVVTVVRRLTRTINEPEDSDEE